LKGRKSTNLLVLY